MKKILIVVGTRPNFIKVTQFKKIAESNFPDLEIKLVHTGQHHSANMSDVFFTQFNLIPDFNLNIDSSSPLTQIGEILIKLEKYIQTEFQPDLIITPGDVNSTLAVAIVANKLNIKLAHLESGLRSNDREMPEEINRILTDELSDYYFITEPSGLENISRENKKGMSFFVGNTMIDTLIAYEPNIDKSDVKTFLGIDDDFVLITLHRPSNVDNPENLQRIINLICQIAEKYQVVFPVHPRTLKRINEFDQGENITKSERIILPEPLGYFEFQYLIKNCKFVLTDSGGIQEETTYRRVPCLTLRTSTERPITTEIGTNTLIPLDIEEILRQILKIENGTYKQGEIPKLWDGNATQRILQIISSIEV